MEHFPEVLRRLRKKNRLSAGALAELCGLSRSVMSLYERGEVTPSAASLIALADFFGCSTDYLLGRC